VRYSLDSEPGLHRRHGSHGFEYVNEAGRLVKAPAILARIKALVIPPAWTDVWICKDADGHLQATGRDVRGRKQYRYHEKYREQRDAHKFDRMFDFAAALPAIRRRARADLGLPGLPRRKVLGALVCLLETTCFRIGNERYAEENDSFGLTTLRNRHVKVAGSKANFEFRGKSGKYQKAVVDDPRLTRIIRRCRDLPGQALFEYLDDDGKPQAIGSSDVNDYLKEIAAIEISAKDFRTWAGTVLVANVLSKREGPVGPSHVVAAVREASLRLGNTPAICRKSYVHPRVLDLHTWATRSTRRASRPARGLRADEAALLRLLAPLRARSKIARLPAPSHPSSRSAAAHPR